MRQKSYKQIESSRNTRLWITTVIMPVMMAGTALYSGNPHVRDWVNNKMFEAKQSYDMKKAELKFKYEEWKQKRS